MTRPDRLTLEEVLAAFDEHLHRTRGVCPGTRRNYARYVGEFLVAVFDDRGVEFAQVRAPAVVAFIGGLSDRYQPRTVEHAATALRVFFRFLRAQGWCEDRLADAVPMVPHRPSGLVRHLDPRVLEQLIASLATASARDLRDRAIILTIARVGLRPGEVAQLRLEDIDWHNAAIRVRARKTGHGALLPLTSEVGAGLADYLQHGRPETDAREVFVLHRLRDSAIGMSSGHKRLTIRGERQHRGESKTSGLWRSIRGVTLHTCRKSQPFRSRRMTGPGPRRPPPTGGGCSRGHGGVCAGQLPTYSMR